MKLFNRKPKNKIKAATAFTLKGLTKQGEIQSDVFDGTIIAYKQVMIKKAS